MTVARRFTMLGLTTALIVGCSGAGATPYPARPAASLPTGATALELPTATPGRPSGAMDTCASALLPPVTLTFDGRLLAFIAKDGLSWRVSWPRGFSARSFQGHAEVVTPDGAVLATEGDVLSNLGGSGGAAGEFAVCQIGSMTYGPAS
jgi:hypothetical protein